MNLQFIILVSIVSIIAGILIRYYDIKMNQNVIINPKKLKSLQVVYSILFAIPFCLFYSYVETNFNP